MFRILVEKEIRDIIGSTKFAVSFAVCASIVVMSFVVGASNYRLMRAEYEANLSANVDQFKGVTDWSQVSYSAVYLPPDPVSTLVQGVSNDIGRDIMVTGRGELRAYNSRYSENPALAEFRFLDLDFVFTVIMSLFAILLCYDAVAGEKENGTLRIVFSNAVPRSKYLMAKLVGCFVSVTIPLLLAIALGAMVLLVFGIPMSGTEWLRLALVSTAGLVLVLFFMTLAICVSAASRGASHALIVLLLVWVLAVQLVPRAAVLVAARMVSVPTNDEIAVQKAIANHQFFDERVKAIAGFKPTKLEPDSAIAEFSQFQEQIADECDKKEQAVVNRLNEQRTNGRKRQEELALGIARISPAASFSLAAMQIAGTDLTLPARFAEQATQYREGYSSFLKGKTGRTPGTFTSNLRKDPKAKSIDLGELPSFQFQQVAVSDAIVATVPGIALMVIFVLGAGIGAVYFFNRYDLR